MRAGRLLASTVDHITAKNRTSALASFISGLSDELFDAFLSTAGSDKEVSSWYLSSVGKLLGHRSLQTALKGDDNASTNTTVENGEIPSHLLVEQTTTFVQNLTKVLAGITEECVSAPHDEEEEPTPMELGNGAPRSPVLQAVSSLGYIPTVPMIGEAHQLNSGDEQLGRLLTGLAAFLSKEDNRVTFCTARASVGRPTTVLATLLDKEVGAPVQVYYQTIFCLWLLSFVGQHRDSTDIERVAQAVEEAGVPRRLTTVLKDVGSEKVVRICLATLRNILAMSPTLRKEMVGAGLVDALQSPSFRRLDDDDIREDLGVLADALESELANMSSFDVYKAEVLSGLLDWTPAHRDEQFWRENVEKLERNQQEVLRCLVRLLHESTDETVLAVACHDLAQFIKFHPRGRAIAQSLGVKARLMQLMVSGEGDVRRYALNCVQVLMIRWNRH